jgi:hypothetical protein
MEAVTHAVLDIVEAMEALDSVVAVWQQFLSSLSSLDSSSGDYAICLGPQERLEDTMICLSGRQDGPSAISSRAM